MSNKNTFITHGELELATAYWYGELNLDNANQAEMRLWKGETFNRGAALIAHQRVMEEDMKKFMAQFR